MTITKHCNDTGPLTLVFLQTCINNHYIYNILVMYISYIPIDITCLACLALTLPNNTKTDTFSDLWLHEQNMQWTRLTAYCLMLVSTHVLIATNWLVSRSSWFCIDRLNKKMCRGSLRRANERQWDAKSNVMTTQSLINHQRPERYIDQVIGDNVGEPQCGCSKPTFLQLLWI